MSTADPISLGQAQRLAANADTILLRATRPADLETPIGAFLRLDDGGPAYLLESVEGGERLGRYSFLGVGPRRLLEVRDGQARIQTRPVTEPTYSADLPVETIAAGDPLAGDPGVRPTPPRPADRGDAALHRRGGRSAGLRRDLGLRADGPAAGVRPGRRPDGRVHRDGPRPRLRSPDPHALGDRLAPHRGAGPRGALPDRRDGDLRGARTDRATERRRDGRKPLAPDRRREAPATSRVRRHRPRSADRSRRASAATSTSTQSRSPRTPSRRVRRSRSSWRAASRSGCRSIRRPARRSTGSACTGPSGASTRARTCSSRGPRPSRSSARRPSSCSRSRVTG